MKKYKGYIIVLFMSLVFAVSYANASGECKFKSRQEKSCNPGVAYSNTCIGTGGFCEFVSSGYTVPYCVSLSDPVADYALDCIWASITNTLSGVPEYESEDGKVPNIPLGRFETRNFIEQYCKALLGTGNMGRIYYAMPSNVKDSWDWQQTFDSHQSIFVYALCSSFKDKKDKEDGMPFIEESYLSGLFINEDLAKVLKLRQMSGGKDLCSLENHEYLEDCDMSVYATKIFSAIMSDIFKIKYAQVLHINTTKNFGSEYMDRVVDFMSGYYDMYFVDWDYIRLKDNFPQTISVLESNQRYYKNVLETVKILDNSKLAYMAGTGEQCSVAGNMTLLDFIACALHSSQGKGFSLTPSFVTLFYNEIMNYRVFELYLNLWIEEKINQMSRTQTDEKIIRKALSKSLDFQGYANLQIEAAKQALLRFEDFNMTYPLHIGLLVYQERIKNFRDNKLSPIVTLFYSLSETLQNVQFTN